VPGLDAIVSDQRHPVHDSNHAIDVFRVTFAPFTCGLPYALAGSRRDGEAESQLAADLQATHVGRALGR
jgi:hypothetical protein